MLIFWRERLVFLATPKTGSTSIAAALEPLAAVSVQRPPPLKHTPVARYRRHVAPWLEKAAGARFDVVALMREPVSWLGSWYRYRSRDEIEETERSTRGLSFDSFVEAYLADPSPEYADLGAQARFLGAGREDGVDRVFRYEAIDGFLAFLEDRLECEITLPRLNVSPQGETPLSDAVAARLRAERAEDFALYAALCEADQRRSCS